MTSSISERVDERAAPSDFYERWGALVIAVCLAIGFGVALPDGPSTITATVHNPTDYRLYIKASTPTDDTLSFVGVVGPGATLESPHVIDRGGDWILHLRTLGSPAGEIAVTRNELTSGSVRIPDSVTDDLEAAGVKPIAASPILGAP